MRTPRQVGMTLIEITIAAAVGTILSASALQLFSSLVKYARMTAMTNDIQDRIRLARELITHDVLRAGYYWAREQKNGAVFTGFFGEAGLGNGIGDPANWPRVPMSGTDSAVAPDRLNLLVPNGEILGANLTPPACDEGAAMTVTVPFTSPQAVFGAPYNNGNVVIGTGSGVVFLTTITGSAQNPAATSTVTLNQLGGGECAIAGSANGTTLPGRFSIYPVEGVIWTASGNNLLRCSATNATGPFGAACNSNSTVVGGIEDFQVRYRFLRVSINAAGVTTAALACYSQTPADLTTAASLVAGNCGTDKPKRRVPDGVANEPMVRFVGFDIGVVARSLKSDEREFLNRGKRPALFNRPAGAADSYRRRKAEWRVVTPNVYVF
jgi:type II secretory pathway pseudopilin PulG